MPWYNYFTRKNKNSNSLTPAPVPVPPVPPVPASVPPVPSPMVQNARTRIAYMGNESKKAKNARRVAEQGAAIVPVLQGATAVGFVAAAAAGATGVLVASAPVSASLLLISLFSVQLLRMYGANKEFEVNCVAITEEVTRMYHIIEVIKQFSNKGKQIKSLNFTKVDVWVNKVLAGLVKMAGDDAFYQIEKELTASSASPSFIALFKKFKDKREAASRYKTFTRKLRRMLQPLEQLRIVVRDITILSIFFQIMLGEFHILLLADTTDPWLTENKAYISFKSQIDPLTQTAVDNNTIKAAEAAATAVVKDEAAPAQEGDPIQIGGGMRRHRRSKAKFERKTYKIKY